MKKSTWHKHHKWFGLILGFFLIMFSLSGLVLNHPMLFSGVNVSRAILPSNYQYQQWNKGLLRGSIAWNKRVLLYGNSGIWVTDSTTSFSTTSIKAYLKVPILDKFVALSPHPQARFWLLVSTNYTNYNPTKVGASCPYPAIPTKNCAILRLKATVSLLRVAHIYTSLCRHIKALRK